MLEQLSVEDIRKLVEVIVDLYQVNFKHRGNEEFAQLETVYDLLIKNERGDI